MPRAAGDAPQRRRAFTAVDVLLIAAVLGLVAFPLLSRAQAASLPLAPADTTTRLDALRTEPAGDLRAMPAFANARLDAAVTSVLGRPRALRDAVEQALITALPDAGAKVFAVAATSDIAVVNGLMRRNGDFAYPYRYPDLEPLLADVPRGSQAVRALNDAAAVLLLADAHAPGQLSNAAPVAYAILDRARHGDECLPQLNLAFLVAAQYIPRDRATTRELVRAVELCPGDPTALWILGQYQSHRAAVNPPDLAPGQDGGERLQRPFETFARLQRELPGSHAGWSGEGDARLRVAYQLVQQRQPFSARNHFRRARALYQRALALSDDAGVRAGLARANAGLRDYDAAVAEQQVALRQRDHAEYEVRLIEYLERAGRFEEAARYGGQFVRETVDLSPRRGLFPHGFPVPVGPDPLYEEDAHWPLSWGSAQLTSVNFALAPAAPGAGGAVLDLAFIPDFRDEAGVTGYDRWCREWSWRRDLVIAGRYAAALDGFAETYSTDRPGAGGDTCFRLYEGPPTPLAAIAAYETGDRAAARAWIRADDFLDLTDYRDEPDPELAKLYDARQNLWRFAGQLERAEGAAVEWVQHSPRSPLALDRRAEIAFLRQRYADAAAHFGAVAGLAGGSLRRAEAQLKQGAALVLAEQGDRARPLLAAASAGAAPHAVPTEEALVGDPGPTARYLRAAFVTYYAAVQTGDLELRARRYAEATAAYSGALAVITQVAETYPPGLGELPWRPEAVHNNLALAHISAGQATAAGAAAEQAVAADPGNPIFLQTRAFALQETGSFEAAAEGYTQALAADPSLFSAANDLGAVRFRQGRTADAVTAFRQAVGANVGYPLAWFNLGVALDRLGGANVLRSQAAFAEAGRLDPSLRDADRDIVFDNDPYFTTLDLSRPLPRDWQFAMNYERAPLNVAGGVLVLVVVRLIVALGRDRLSGTASQRLLEIQRNRAWRRLGALNGRTWAWVAVAGTVLVLLWPALTSEGTSATERLLLGTAALILAVLYVRGRVVYSRIHDTPISHRTWPAALLLAAVTTGAGAGWTPMPVSESDAEVPRLHVIGPVLVGAVVVLPLVLSRLTGVPLTRAMGAGGVTVAASLLLPVHPYDGASMGARTALVLDLTLLAVAVAMFFGVL